MLIILPSYTYLEHETADLVAELVQWPGAELLQARGLGLIDRVRSELASNALQTSHEWWFWLDADTAMFPSAVQHLLEEAKRRRDVDLLAGVYMTRQPGGRPACEFDHDSDSWPNERRNQVVFGTQGNLYPIQRVGFGACMTHRRLFERVASGLPEVDFAPPGTPGGVSGWPFFHPIVKARQYVGEDYSLCDRARAAGCKLWADTRVRVGHVGRYVYRWEDARRVAPSDVVDMTLDISAEEPGTP